MPMVYADLLARSRAALAVKDGAAFAQTTAELGERLVASGFDGVEGDPAPRVRRCTDALRALLGRVAFMVPPGPRDVDAVAALERACLNADVRAATYGYPRLPSVAKAQGSTETGRGRGGSREPSTSRRAPGAGVDRRAGPEERDRSEPEGSTS